MNRSRLHALFIVVWAVAACATAQHRSPKKPAEPIEPADAPMKPSTWPPLPTNSIIGRAATPEDVRAGRAVFAAQAKDLPPPVALQIGVPQYAYCVVDGKKAPGIIVQAESAGGMDVVGFRPLTGTKAYLAPLEDCKLLGRTATGRP